MDVSSTTAAAATNTTSNSTTPARSNSLDYNTFLKLLIAQAKNQDPTNPTDTTQYIEQFSAMSQVEQSVQTNQKLSSILSAIEGLRADVDALQADGTSET